MLSLWSRNVTRNESQSMISPNGGHEYGTEDQPHNEKNPGDGPPGEIKYRAPADGNNRSALERAAGLTKLPAGQTGASRVA